MPAPLTVTFLTSTSLMETKESLVMFSWNCTLTGVPLNDEDSSKWSLDWVLDIYKLQIDNDISVRIGVDAIAPAYMSDLTVF
jgi:hypothetical protein